MAKKLLFLFVVIFIAANVTKAQWVQTNGPYGGTVYSFAVSGTNIFAGTWGGGVWKRALSEMITGTNDKPSEVPTDFSLLQNYPNPFNPSTTINYSVPQPSFVTIKIYDVLGKEAATLINEEKLTGNYEVKFNASNLQAAFTFTK